MKLFAHILAAAKNLLFAALLLTMAVACGAQKEMEKAPAPKVELPPSPPEPTPEPAPTPPPVVPQEEEDEEEEEEYEGGTVYFVYGSSEPNAASKKELNQAIAFLKRNKRARVTLSGHTCNTSRASFNLRLSEQRAEIVASYLQHAGINRKRITVKACGQTQPLVPNTSERNKAKNRRVEISISMP